MTPAANLEIIFVICLVSGFTVIAVRSLIMPARAARALRQRTAVPIEDWYELFPEYSNSDKRHLLSVATIVANAVGVPVTSLRPTDHLWGDYFSRFWFQRYFSCERWEAMLTELARYIEAERKRPLNDAENCAPRAWMTLDDVLQNSLRLLRTQDES